jgi:hypothetical protein
MNASNANLEEEGVFMSSITQVTDISHVHVTVNQVEQGVFRQICLFSLV